MQALSGFASMHGEPPREPLRLPGWQMECFAGTYAAIAAVGALLDGRGRLIDVGVRRSRDLRDGVADGLVGVHGQAAEARRSRRSSAYYPLNIWPCREGSVVMPFYAPRDWDGLARGARR